MSRREWLRRAETAWLKRFADGERRLVRWTLLAATRLGDGWGLGILVPMALLIGGRTTGVATVALGTIEAVTLALLVHGIKSLVRRQRPTGIEVDRPITAPDEHAFPSGHSAQAFGMVLIAWNVSPTLGIVTLIVATLIALSRLFFGLHYPTDVVVGALLGLSWSWTVLWASERLGLTAWLLQVAT